MDMPLHPSWFDIGIRLTLTMLAGAIIGFNRGSGGHAAGLRTTILVGLAASVAMIQTNILLPLGGKTSESFAVMDMMRLPLGILTGVGFIGGGAILRRGDLITGVTTAATLWLVTVIGLCLGGGQLILGIVTTALAVLTLWALKWVEPVIPREHRALLEITCDATANVANDLPILAKSMNCDARLRMQRQNVDANKADYAFDLTWQRPEPATLPFNLINLIESRYRINVFELVSNDGR